MRKFKSFKQYVLVIVVMMTSVSVFSENLIRPFISGSYSQILEKRSKPFVLILWSLDCPSCYKELEMLSQFNKRHIQHDIVLVSTDIEASNNEIQAVLKEYKLEHIESWVFSGTSDESLRFEVDPSWHGELPRSYLFKTRDKKQVISGLLVEKNLLAWMKY